MAQRGQIRRGKAAEVSFAAAEAPPLIFHAPAVTFAAHRSDSRLLRWHCHLHRLHSRLLRSRCKLFRRHWELLRCHCRRMAEAHDGMSEDEGRMAAILSRMAASRGCMAEVFSGMVAICECMGESSECMAVSGDRMAGAEERPDAISTVWRPAQVYGESLEAYGAAPRQVSPKLCSMPISAAFSACRVCRPTIFHLLSI
jgi:hypothetical protein